MANTLPSGTVIKVCSIDARITACLGLLEYKVTLQVENRAILFTPRLLRESPNPSEWLTGGSFHSWLH